MADKATQDGRLLRITTPLDEDYLLLENFKATEGISMLYSVEVDLLHEEDDAGGKPTIIDPKSLLGQIATVELTQADDTKRTLSGMITRFAQGGRDTRFTFYQMEIRPAVWVLTQHSQSRIFQHKSVPDILKSVFEGFEVSFQVKRTYKPRNYCVQYRETDFDFVSRLMEEEGIFYYFSHKDGEHKLIIADTPEAHQLCPTRNEIPFHLKYEGENFVAKVMEWETNYKLQTGKVTFWDHNFQLPGKKLEASITSRFDIAMNKQMEVYDFPAGYARKYDGISSSNGETPEDLQNIFSDNQQTVKNAIDVLDSRYKTGKGSADCSSMTAGHRFKLLNHPTTDFNGDYVITWIEHTANQSPSFTTGEEPANAYTNSFECISFGAGAPPFVPERKVPKPVIQGSQTAYVVGPAGEEIYTDKYGRVKVELNWDRDTKADADSSCWVRVAQSWAANNWGSMFIPRIGMEVLVHFLEGDPDQPIITGCVYNPAAMPPYKLPDEKTKSTIKTNSSKGGGGFNEFRFEDKKGSEQIFVHAEKDQDIRVKNDRREYIANDRHLKVLRDKREQIDRDTHMIVKRDVVEKIERDYHRHVLGKIAYKTDTSVSHEVGTNLIEKIGSSHYEDVAQEVYIKAGMKIILEAGTQISLKVGGNFVDISPAGVTIVGTPVVNINSGGSAGTGSSQSVVAPKDPDVANTADNADPGSDAPTYKTENRQVPGWKIPAYKHPSHKRNSPTNEDKKSWIEIVLKDADGNPVPGEHYRVTLPDGTTLDEGTLDENGLARVDNIDPGSCKVTFPRLDGKTWKEG
jgi:type VI secretion system secreted protein VgrG